MTIKYETPRLATWGTVTELTLGEGGTNWTDDFICQPGQSTVEDAQLFGSTGKCSGTKLPRPEGT